MLLGILLTVRQATAKASISISLIYDLCSRGILPHIRLGRLGKRGTIRVDSDELEAFLRACRVERPIPSAPPRFKPLNLPSPS